jgi:hypothetical protein
MGRITEKKVCWVPPSQLDRAEGQYREVAEPGDDPMNGRLVQWVDEAPDDPRDGSGHFVVYDGEPGDYKPIKKD